MTIIPRKLKAGDHIRVVSPAVSLAIIPDFQVQLATERWQHMGFRVSFSEHARELNDFQSSSVASRVEDLHTAFTDPDVDGILTTLGGYNANQLLSHLDYELICANPKMFCGFSDITVLQTAILAKAGLVTYSGPHFTTLGMKKGIKYTLEYFAKCVMGDKPIIVEPADHWSDDRWYMDQENRELIPNDGYVVINEGEAEGMILGGNLCTFNLVQGTEFMPDIADTILFIEDDNLVDAGTFDRDLQSLIHQPDFGKVRGLVIGRFQKESKMPAELVVKIVHAKPELAHLPIVANASFGHTTPFFTFPQGGMGRLVAKREKVELVIERH